jgi:hypothetical protein
MKKNLPERANIKNGKFLCLFEQIFSKLSKI